MFQNGGWNRHYSNIAIFDDTFVDQNICSGLTIESEHRQKLHELILGAQGVALNQAVQRHVADVEDSRLDRPRQRRLAEARQLRRRA
jgi:hypothetical protein